MKKRTFIIPVAVLVGFLGLPSDIPQAHAEDEIDEELKSTISSDPEYRGKKAPKSEPAAPAAPATPAAEPAPAAAPSTPPSDGAGDGEGGEWETMHSESGRPSRSGAGKSVSASSIKVDLENSRIRTPKISFKSNSDSPTPESRAVLKQLAAVLAQSPELTVRIEGHTDTIGYDQPNLELSQRRADRVKEILTQDGVNATRLQAIGMGDRHPIASSVTTAGQEKNRRVEFHLADGSPARGPAPAPAAPPPPPPPTTMPAAPAVK